MRDVTRAFQLQPTSVHFLAIEMHLDEQHPAVLDAVVQLAVPVPMRDQLLV